MKKWMKGFAIAGVVCLCVGTGMTALAEAASGGRIGTMRGPGNLWQMWPFYQKHLGGHLPGWLGDRLSRRISEEWEEAGDIVALRENFPSDEGGSVASRKEEMTLTAAFDQVRELKVKGRGAVLRIVESDELTDQIAVYIKKEGGAQVTCRTDESPSELEVEYYCDQGGYHGNVEGLIEIPGGYRFDKLELEAEGARIEMPAAYAGAIEAEAEGAAIYLDAFEADTLKAEAMGGQIQASGSVGKKVEAEVEAGRVELNLEGRREDFFYETDVSNGRIMVEGMDATAVSSGQSGAKQMKLECSVGEILVDFR